jgi:hypothetical protein
MKHLIGTTALAAVFALGFNGAPLAQAVNPSQPGSASGGITAQGGSGMGQPGMTQPGQGSTGMTQPGQGGSSMTQPRQGGTSMTQPGTSGTSQSGAGQASALSEDAIRASLRARGYSDIEGLERDGDHFKVGEAKRYGEDVSDLRVDARTGQVRDEERLSEDQARTMLEDRGFSDISDVSRDGDTISAKAKQGDREVNLRIDARSGTVTQQQASN